MTEPQPIIQLDRITYRIGDVSIISDLSLDVAAAETLVLLGESGCGKTTTLKLINRLIEPTSGTARVDGKATSEWDAIELRRRIGYVLQEGGLFPHFTIRENVGLVPRLLKWDQVRIEARTDEILDLVNLPAARFADRYPHELSGGQRQRVGVARALVADPDIVLLDEPFGALDVLTRRSLQKEFASMVREMGKTAVFVTHDLHEAKLLGNRIALMEKGKIVFLGTPDEFSGSDLPLATAYLETIAV
ncbi:MAG: ATP-binding cassette domain-containing protein [bacterium]|nr:ATP-binding cassette domain-containing protein [bacterium]